MAFHGKNEPYPKNRANRGDGGPRSRPLLWPSARHYQTHILLYFLFQIALETFFVARKRRRYFLVPKNFSYGTPAKLPIWPSVYKMWKITHFWWKFFTAVQRIDSLKVKITSKNINASNFPNWSIKLNWNLKKIVWFWKWAEKKANFTSYRL